MNRVLLGLLPLASMGCIENIYQWTEPRVNEPDPGAIQGRICDPSGRGWLADATVFTNLTDESGRITDVRRASSDRDGLWRIDGLPGNVEYTVYVQSGPDLLDSSPVYVGDAEEVVLPSPTCFDPTALDIALITGDYDDVDNLLEDLGFTSYTRVDGTDSTALTAFLTDPVALSKFDIVFFNGGHVEAGVIYDSNPANPVPSRVAQNLQAYVASGGSVFATDWAYDVVERAWPDAIDFMGDDRTPDAAQLGEYESVNAAVTDESLAAFIGKSWMAVEYDLPVWPPIVGVQPYVSVHLSGNVSYRQGQSSYTLPAVPLLVSFSEGQGRVGFSTFRFASNRQDDTRLALQHLLGVLQD